MARFLILLPQPNHADTKENGVKATHPKAALFNSTEKKLPIDHVWQSPQSKWCWAACAAMVVNLIHEQAHDKCEFAVELFGNSQCCVVPDDCNETADVSEIEGLLDSFEVTANHQSSPITFDELKSEINGDRPILVAYQGTPRGHLVAVGGWHDSPDGEYVYLHNPIAKKGPALIKFSKLQNGNYGTWDDIWIGLEATS